MALQAGCLVGKAQTVIAELKQRIGLKFIETGGSWVDPLAMQQQGKGNVSDLGPDLRFSRWIQLPDVATRLSCKRRVA